MKPSILDDVESQELDLSKIKKNKIKSTLHLLMTFWSSNESSKIEEYCDYYFQSKVRDNVIYSYNSYPSNFGTLSVIDISVDYLNLKEGPASWRDLSNFLIFFSNLSITPLTITLLKKEKEKYYIYYQKLINKEEINKDRCKALMNTLRTFKEEKGDDFYSICDDIQRYREAYANKYIKGKEFLTITNLSSSKDIPQEARDVMTKIIKAGRSQFLTQYDYLLPYHEEDPLPIHIYLKKSEDMPDYKKIWEIEDKNKDIDKYIPQGKVLGYYKRKDNEIDAPHIVLCPESIEECSGEISVENLYALVLVHEMSHAILDRYYEHWLYKPIYEDWNIEEVECEQYLPKSLYSRAMEESLANMMALMWIKSYKNHTLLDQSLHFIRNQQPAIYQFGEYQFKANVDWKKWRNSTKDMISLKKWFKTFFKDGSIIGTVQHAFNAVFETQKE